jgi:HPt (histidine-containing phosphotransfer) domain-containing protein
MLGSAGRSEFFAREAGDYLRALAALLGASPPEGDSFVRLARALRGAAMLAGPASYTRAASQLEHIAKQLREGVLSWEDVRPALGQAHAELERLTAHVAAWDESGDRAAFALANQLRTIAHSAPPPTTPPPGEQAAESIRTFVAREAAAVAGAAGEAARATMGASAPPVERLGRVTQAMQSLRGLAGLTELAPLPDLLDATDAAVRELQRYPILPPGASDLCATAADAFSRVAREVADQGRPDPELGEAHRFADQLLRTLAGPEVVVPIETLNGGGPVLQRPEPRFAEPLDLASLGERLRAGADQLRDATANAAARLQALVLLAVLRDAPGGLGRRPAGRLVARLVDALADAVAEGDPTALAPALDRAGRHLAEGARGDLTALENALELVELEPEPVPIDTLLEVESIETVVDIGDLAPAPERPAIDIPADRSRLERSLTHYSRLVRENAPVQPLDTRPRPSAPEPELEPEPEPEPVLWASTQPMGIYEPEVIPIEDLAPEELASLELDDDEPVAIDSLAPDFEAFEDEVQPVAIEDLAPDLVEPVPIEALAPEGPEADRETDVVPIESLLYSGRAALERANQVRQQLEQALQSASHELDRVAPLVRELLDLVPLALARDD